LTKLVVHELAVHLLAATAHEGSPLAGGLAHGAEHVAEDHGLEVHRHLADLCGVRRRAGLPGRGGRGCAGQARDVHHMTSISASRAPASRMACRIEIRSRGVTPSELSPCTTSPMLAPSRTTMSCAFSSLIFTSLLGTTTVRALSGASGGGCETSLSSRTV